VRQGAAHSKPAGPQPYSKQKEKHKARNSKQGSKFKTKALMKLSMLYLVIRLCFDIWISNLSFSALKFLFFVNLLPA
jgi:hypothetical protein